MTKRNYKDSVFTALFNDPDLLRELYCALEGITLPSDVPVSINTLQNVLYLDLYNDISFEIGGKLVILIEHQSTINPNMALRLLLYISRILEKRTEGVRLYSKKKLTIPWPEFFILYNGKEPYPDVVTLKLSDLFDKPQDLGIPEKSYPLLELEVKVININEGRNSEIVNKCKKLAEYSFFIAKIREFLNETGNLEESIAGAVNYCSKHDILEKFLQIHGSEVLNMLWTECSSEDVMAFLREEAREEGREEGREESQNFILNLFEQGFSLEEVKLHLTKNNK